MVIRDRLQARLTESTPGGQPLMMMNSVSRAIPLVFSTVLALACGDGWLGDYREEAGETGSSSTGDVAPPEDAASSGASDMEDADPPSGTEGSEGPEGTTSAGPSGTTSGGDESEALTCRDGADCAIQCYLDPADDAPVDVDFECTTACIEQLPVEEVADLLRWIDCAATECEVLPGGCLQDESYDQEACLVCIGSIMLAKNTACSSLEDVCDDVGE